MKSSFNWKPKFPENHDRKIRMCDDKVQTFSVSREVGVMISEDVKKQSPACFWIDEQNVYLRMNWSTWYRVSNDAPEVISAICKRHTAKLTQIVGNCSKDCFIPVFHIDRLPAELFDGVLYGDEAGENASDPKSVARVRLAADMADRMGDVIGEYSKGEGEFILIRGKRCLMLVSFFAHRDTEWAADEESFNGDPPLWFSPTSHLQSPLYIVGAAAEYLKNEFEIDAIPVVLLDDGIDIVNADAAVDEWRKTGVRVCYRGREDDVIPAFDPELFATQDEAPDDRTVAAAKAALDDFIPMSPKDWEKFLQEGEEEYTSASPDDATGRRYCLGRYHSDEPCGDFLLMYDFHRLLLLPDESSAFPPTMEALKQIGRMISEAGVYSDFGLTDRKLPDDPDEARADAEAADRLFIRVSERGKKPPYDAEHSARLKDWLVQIERFWRRGNPTALRDVGLTKAPLWSLVFETEPAALFFQYPGEQMWREHSKELLDDYIEEYALATRDHQELTIFCVVILESSAPEDLRQLNTSSPPGMFFVSPETLNETVMKIFMEEVFDECKSKKI